MPLVKCGFRGRIIGAENIPREGGAVLASNHIATMDPIILPVLVPRVLTFPAKKELFEGKSLGGRIVAWFLRAVEMVPMDRGGGRASADSLAEISAVLEKGNLVGFYPEGTRSPDGRLYRGHTGMARMALANDVPILPVGIIGAETKRGFLGIPWVKKPLVIVGEPMRFPQYAGAKSIRVQRWVTDEVMAAIQKLTGQRYVEVYGYQVKNGSLSAEEIAKQEKARPGGGEPPQVNKA